MKEAIKALENLNSTVAFRQDFATKTGYIYLSGTSSEAGSFRQTASELLAFIRSDWKSGFTYNIVK